MHEGFTLNTDFIMEGILGAVIAVIAFFFKKGESLSERRIETLEKNQEANTKKIGEIDSRVVAIEHSYVKQADMRELVDTLQKELNNEINKSFSRVHTRIDDIFSGAACATPEAPERHYPSESPRVSLARPYLEKKKK